MRASIRPDPQCLRITGWLETCSDDEVAEIAAASRLIVLRRDETVATTDERPEHLFVLVRGRIGAFKTYHPADDPIICFIADRPGAVLCAENVLSGLRQFATMRALDPGTELVAIPARALFALLSAHPEITFKLATFLAVLVQTYIEQWADLGLLDVPRRLAKFLVANADLRTMTVTLRLSQKELANRLSASRQFVNQALSSFVQRGLIIPSGRGRYSIRDLNAMQALAGLAHESTGSPPSIAMHQ